MKSPSHQSSGRSFVVLVFLANFVLAVWLSGCRISPDQTGEKILALPGEPGGPAVIVEDIRSDGENGNWMAQYIIGGIWADTWFVNQYERPFSAYDMVYQPHLDIKEARIRPAGEWTVFEVQSVSPAAGERVYISLWR